MGGESKTERKKFVPDNRLGGRDGKVKSACEKLCLKWWLSLNLVCAWHTISILVWGIVAGPIFVSTWSPFPYLFIFFSLSFKRSLCEARYFRDPFQGWDESLLWLLLRFCVCVIPHELCLWFSVPFILHGFWWAGDTQAWVHNRQNTKSCSALRPLRACFVWHFPASFRPIYSFLQCCTFLHDEPNCWLSSHISARFATSSFIRSRGNRMRTFHGPILLFQPWNCFAFYITVIMACHAFSAGKAFFFCTASAPSCQPFCANRPDLMRIQKCKAQNSHAASLQHVWGTVTVIFANLVLFLLDILWSFLEGAGIRLDDLNGGPGRVGRALRLDVRLPLGRDRRKWSDGKCLVAWERPKNFCFDVVKNAVQKEAWSRVEAKLVIDNYWRLKAMCSGRLGRLLVLGWIRFRNGTLDIIYYISTTIQWHWWKSNFVYDQKWRDSSPSSTPFWSMYISRNDDSQK